MSHSSAAVKSRTRYRVSKGTPCQLRKPSQISSQPFVTRIDLDFEEAELVMLPGKWVDAYGFTRDGHHLVVPAKHVTKVQIPAPEQLPLDSEGQIPAELVKRIHRSLQDLASCCDGANKLDHAGFARTDAAFGHGLASQAELTQAQALAAVRLIVKYHRQLDPAIVEAVRAYVRHGKSHA